MFESVMIALNLLIVVGAVGLIVWHFRHERPRALWRQRLIDDAYRREGREPPPTGRNRRADGHGGVIAGDAGLSVAPDPDRDDREADRGHATPWWQFWAGDGSADSSSDGGGGYGGAGSDGGGGGD